MKALLDDVVPPTHAEKLILAFSEAELLPIVAMRSAVAHWEQVWPTFVEQLSAPFPEAEREAEEGNPVFLIVYLCAQMRERRAYRPLLRLLCLPPATVEWLFGDMVTEHLPRIAASVFDGDAEPMKAMILDPAVNEYVRDALFEALAFLTREGKIDAAETTLFIQSCWDRLLPRDENMVWCGWQSAIAHLGLAVFAPLVREAFDEGWISPLMMEFRHFEQDLEKAVAAAAMGERFMDSRWGYLDDAVTALSGWYGYSEAYQEDKRRWKEIVQEDGLIPSWEPVRNPLRHVGRNDPCPCGSGKKYKKCCLSKAPADLLAAHANARGGA